MNVYKVIFDVPYGTHVCVVTAKDKINALDLALHKLYSTNQTVYKDEDVESNIEELPLLSKTNKEEAIFIWGYEE